MNNDRGRACGGRIFPAPGPKTTCRVGPISTPNLSAGNVRRRLQSTPISAPFAASHPPLPRLVGPVDARSPLVDTTAGGGWVIGATRAGPGGPGRRRGGTARTGRAIPHRARAPVGWAPEGRVGAACRGRGERRGEQGRAPTGRVVAHNPPSDDRTGERFSRWPIPAEPTRGRVLAACVPRRPTPRPGRLTRRPGPGDASTGSPHTVARHGHQPRYGCRGLTHRGGPARASFAVRSSGRQVGGSAGRRATGSPPGCGERGDWPTGTGGARTPRHAGGISLGVAGSRTPPSLPIARCMPPVVSPRSGARIVSSVASRSNPGWRRSVGPALTACPSEVRSRRYRPAPSLPTPASPGRGAPMRGNTAPPVGSGVWRVWRLSVARSPPGRVAARRRSFGHEARDTAGCPRDGYPRCLLARCRDRGGARGRRGAAIPGRHAPHRGCRGTRGVGPARATLAVRDVRSQAPRTTRRCSSRPAHGPRAGSRSRVPRSRSAAGRQGRGGPHRHDTGRPPWHRSGGVRQSPLGGHRGQGLGTSCPPADRARRRSTMPDTRHRRHAYASRWPNQAAPALATRMSAPRTARRRGASARHQTPGRVWCPATSETARAPGGGAATRAVPRPTSTRRSARSGAWDGRAPIPAMRMAARGHPDTARPPGQEQWPG